MKIKASSRSTTLVLVSLLSCLFSLFYFSQHDFQFSPFLPNIHDVGKDTHPVINRLPSVEYIDLATNHTLSRTPYNIYPAYGGQKWSQVWHGSQQQPCMGPRGVNVNNDPNDMMEAWEVDPIGPCLVSSCSPIETDRWQSSQSRTDVWLLRRKWTR